MGIQRCHENFVAQDRETSIHMPATRTDVAWNLPLIHPDRPSRPRIERKRAIVLPRRVENSVHDQGSRLQLARGSGLVDPLRRHVADVARVDLVEPAETPT